jgi:hypothetical protein
MKPPYILSRLTGSPFIALLLFGLYAVIIHGWSQGRVSLWFAAIAGAFAIATGNSVIEVQHYKRMMANFEAGVIGLQKAEARRRKPSWFSMLLAAALLIFIPTLQADPQVMAIRVYGITWLLSLLYFVFSLYKVARIVKPRPVRERKQKQTSAEPMPVEYLVREARSSPSFDEARDKLPDYCLNMLRPNDRNDNKLSAVRRKHD